MNRAGKKLRNLKDRKDIPKQIHENLKKKRNRLWAQLKQVGQLLAKPIAEE